MTELLADTITRLAASVGFAADAPLEGLPPDGRTWVSDYAVLVLWPLQVVGQEALKAAESGIEDAIDPLLQDDAVRFGSLLDIYGIIALPDAPPDDLRPVIDGVHMRRQFYRAAVIWPDAETSDGWAGLDSVTILDLPRSTAEIDSLDPPDLTNDERDLLAIFQADPTANGGTLAEKVVEDIRGKTS